MEFKNVELKDNSILLVKGCDHNMATQICDQAKALKIQNSILVCVNADESIDDQIRLLDEEYMAKHGWIRMGRQDEETLIECGQCGHFTYQSKTVGSKNLCQRCVADYTK